ncbi:hypothetical protein [Pseudomonas abietaniphila]|uniref:Uncharacterized protein n=1 Tax=Pseudomonas abietaniphila TaxID=89065 RepID=A0A1G8QWC7_9PSED|nr:hypothetical protein [Pseudomonas abietaniphila]SDJ09042.1 hypothetical protein SAMN05216605_12186 [Pseudomonas abietaniphila]
MDSRLTRILIAKVISGLVFTVTCLIALMAYRAGQFVITPDRIYMGIFLLVVGGAVFKILETFIAVPAKSDEQISAEADGTN